MLATLAGALLASLTPQGPLPFVDYSDELDKPSFALVVGTLGKITEGKKERLKGGDGTLDEGNVSTSVSGTVFTKVQSTAKLAVSKLLHGTKETSVAVAFDMQVAKLGDGSQKRHFLLTPRVPLEDNMLGLFFLDKDKGKLVVTKVLRYAADKNITSEKFERLCEDLHALNTHIKEIREACDTATRLRVTDKKAAIEALRKVLQKKPTLREPQSENWWRMELSAHVQKARELLESLGGKLEGSPDLPLGEVKKSEPVK